MNVKRYIPTYEEAVEMCSYSMSPFYETKLVVDGFNVSLFNYRLANHGDFVRNIVEIQSNDGILIKINGDMLLDGKKIKDMTDDELISIGFENLSKFKIH